MYFKDQNRIYPTSVVVREGDSIEVKCNGLGKVTWYKDSDINKIETGTVLKLHSIRIDDQGYYVCKGKNEINRSFQARTLVKVDGKTAEL